MKIFFVLLLVGCTCQGERVQVGVKAIHQCPSKKGNGYIISAKPCDYKPVFACRMPEEAAVIAQSPEDKTLFEILEAE